MPDEHQRADRITRAVGNWLGAAAARVYRPDARTGSRVQFMQGILPLRLSARPETAKQPEFSL